MNDVLDWRDCWSDHMRGDYVRGMETGSILGRLKDRGNAGATNFLAIAAIKVRLSVAVRARPQAPKNFI